MALTDAELAELRRVVELERLQQGQPAQQRPPPPPPSLGRRPAADGAAAVVAAASRNEVPASGGNRSNGRVWLLIIAVGVAIWYFYPSSFVQQSNRKVERPIASESPKPRIPAPARPSEIPEFAAFVENVVNRNARSIESVLVVATNETSAAAIDAAAIVAGRDYNFEAHKIDRNRKVARGLHDPVREDLNRPGDVQRVCDVMRSALNADPVDVEIAGNLAICLFRVGQFSQSLNFARYALSIPRAPNKTGRTADWVTLGAAYAALGDQNRARGALFVSLGIASNVELRCKSAIYAVRNTFGPALQDATAAMLQRVSTLGLSQSPECAIPTQW